MRNDILEWHIQEAGHEISYNYDLVKLDHDGNRVTGAVFATPEGLVRVNAAKGTLLATGGYAANPEMIRANLPLVPACCTAASYSPRCDGYGLRAGLWAGGIKDVNGAPSHLRSRRRARRRGLRLCDRRRWARALPRHPLPA